MQTVHGVETRIVDTVIVGGGLMGCSTALALAKRGQKNIEVLEKKWIGAGATGKSSGILRCHYSIPVLGYMAWKSLQVFQNAAEIFGDDLGYTKAGYLVIGGQDSQSVLKANVEALRQVGVDTYLVSREEVRERYPSIFTEDTSTFAYEPQGGFADASLTVQAYAASARGLGVNIVQGLGVTRILTSSDASRVVGVETDRETIFAPTVIVAAGTWSRPLFAGIRIDAPIRPQLQRLLSVHPEVPVQMPVVTDLVNLQYVRTEKNGNILIGDIDDSRPEFVAPDDYERSISLVYQRNVVDRFLHRFPSLENAKLATGYTGAYEVTPDHNPIISKTPVDGLYLCAGFSGHGFKLSPIVGELMADLILVGKSQDDAVDLSSFRLSRYADGELLLSKRQYNGAEQLI